MCVGGWALVSEEAGRGLDTPRVEEEDAPRRGQVEADIAGAEREQHHPHAPVLPEGGERLSPLVQAHRADEPDRAHA